MTSSELAAFAEIFNGLARILMVRRFEDGERERTLSDYFKALRGFPLEGVRGAAETLAQRAKHFPKPVEWIEAIPRVDHYADVPFMARHEASEHRRAHVMGYEDEPCSCQSCRQAEVSHLPLRFVPEFDSDDRPMLVKDMDGKRVVTAGHWAHGQELRRWYDAKARCFSMADGFQKRAIALIGKHR